MRLDWKEERGGLDPTTRKWRCVTSGVAVSITIEEQRGDYWVKFGHERIGPFDSLRKAQDVAAQRQQERAAEIEEQIQKAFDRAFDIEM